MRRSLVVLAVLHCALSLAPGAFAEDAPSKKAAEVSQYGITWKFDRQYPVGQFITGDWWVVGPVKVVEVTPAPGPAPMGEATPVKKNQYGDTSLRDDSRMRNGSMVVLRASGRQGYDSRSQTYRPEESAKFPATIEASRSLISTVSNPAIPVPNFATKIMWGNEKRCQNVLKTAAVLTVLDKAPPADAFRPPYAGTDKPIYRASQLHWELLKNLAAPKIDANAYARDYEARFPDDWEQMERYFQRPWLEHVLDWPQQQLNPNENQPNYGREHGRLVSIASLMIHLDVPRERKEKLLVGLVQYGIDNAGLARVGGSWNWGGGHSSGRKFPVVLASLILGDESLRKLPETCVFHEDAQTYYGLGWAGQTVLYWMVTHHGQREHYEEKPPTEWQQWDRTSESYRVCCNARAWVGMALSIRLMQAIKVWNHDAFFDYVDRWMAQQDDYAELRRGRRRPNQEGSTYDPFVDAMWHRYRDTVPEQPAAGNPKMFVWQGRQGAWVANPKPSADEIAAHLKKLKEAAKP